MANLKKIVDWENRKFNHFEIFKVVFTTVYCAYGIALFVFLLYTAIINEGVF